MGKGFFGARRPPKRQRFPRHEGRVHLKLSPAQSIALEAYNSFRELYRDRTGWHGYPENGQQPRVYHTPATVRALAAKGLVKILPRGCMGTAVLTDHGREELAHRAELEQIATDVFDKALAEEFSS
jgi:hypothetical protein